MTLADLHAKFPMLRRMSLHANLYALRLVDEYGIKAMRHEIEKACFEMDACQRCSSRTTCETFNRANKK